ncbi:MAG: cadherin-like beta sandwich domain-containing protein [Oscillospiraceae bacterium]
MKIKKVLQRVCAFTIAIATISTSLIITPQTVEAASQYYVKFIDNISKVEDRTATLLEGETIKTATNMPPNYKYLNPPFKVKGFSEKDSPIQVTPEGNIIAKSLDAGVDTMTLYTVEPVFSAFLTKSDTGVARCIVVDPIDPTNKLAKTVALEAEVLNNRDISITEASKLTLTVSENQTDPKGGYLSFAPVEADGGLSEFQGGIATFKKRDRDNITVEITKDGRKIELKLNAAFPELMLLGSKFELTFALQTLGDLQLTVISNKKAIDTIATDIGAAANFEDFIKLKIGDTQHTISSRFNVIHTERRYNNKDGFKIDWAWKPKNGSDDNSVVTIVGDPADDTWLVTPYPKLENVMGNLEATVSYDGIISQKVLVPITILGTGSYPKLKAIYTYTGDVATGGKPIPITTGIPPGKMDVNDGQFDEFKTEIPFKFTGELQYGTGLGKAENIKIEFDKAYSGKVDICIDNATSIYKPGTMLPAPSEGGREGTRALTVKATEAGLCVMKVYFYNKSGDPYNNSPKIYNIEIQDSSPLKDASFKSMKMVGTPVNDKEYQDRFEKVYPGGVIDFSFNIDPNQRIYKNITVPWAVEKINLTPIYNSFGKTKTYPVTVISGSTSQKITGTGGNGIPPDVNVGITSDIELKEDGTPQIIYVNGVAEDGITFSRYELHVTRAPKSDIASLEALTIISKKDGKDEEHVLTPKFDPITYTYNLSLPYAYREGNIDKTTTEIRAAAFGDWGADPEFKGAVKEPNIFKQIFDFFFRKSSAELNLKYVKATENINTVLVSVKSEDGKKTATYTVNIKIEDPSENNKLSLLNTYDKIGKPLPYYNNQKFEKDSKDYYLEIPYNMEELKLELQPDDEKAQKVRITHPEVYKPDTNPQVIEYKKKGTTIPIKIGVPCPKEDEKDKAKYMKFDYKFEVQAESDEWTTQPYTLHITRLDPSTDSRLASMAVVNATDSKPVDTFRFSQQKIEYSFEVPFTTEEVVVSPVAVKPNLTTVTIGDTKISENMPGKIIKLKAGTATTVTVLALPEAGKEYQTTYTLNITRKAPGTEARLQKIDVSGGQDMTPSPFVPSNTRYTISIPQGTQSYTITTIPVDDKSTVTINGKEVENGKPSQPIVSVTPITNIPIVVTAEDGKTKLTYTLTVKDYNLMKKSTNADLSDLKINYANLAPKFKSSIDEYELYVKPETKSLDLTPITANGNAKMEVLVGSKKLTPYGGVYSSSLFINKTIFTINIMAEDGVTAKTYTINVFRNDKNKMGAFKPITADMVDFEKQNPIVIDISNYAVIDASVFNKLKTDYPDKSILFKGNDYMLNIAGKDIKDLVPHTALYDLYFSFSTPDEQLIQDILDTNEKDWDLEPVYLYFDDHGPLPGKMILTVNLGREYKNEQLFWNYYNGERQRIDYYGYVKSNARGTFTVPITHMSTYMVAKTKIVVAEDKTGSGFGTVEGAGQGSGSENANSGTTGDKNVPKTGVYGSYDNANRQNGGLK